MNRADDLDWPSVGNSQKVPLWRNLYFVKGGTLWGLSHPTERLAKEYSDGFFADWPVYMAETGDDMVDLRGGGQLPFGDFLCAIAIPIAREE